MARAVVLMSLLLLACHGKEVDAPSVSPRELAPTSNPGAPRAATDPQVTRFWKWFSDHAAALAAEKDLKVIMERVNTQLAKVNSEVFAEIGIEGDDHLLVITADGIRALFPVVQQVYRARPGVPGWKIVAFRQRSKPGKAFSVEMGGRKVSPADVRFVAETAGSKLAVRVFLPGFDHTDQMKQIAYVLMDNAVGEYDMETKIGEIGFAPLDAAPAGAKPLTELAAAVDALP